MDQLLDYFSCGLRLNIIFFRFPLASNGVPSSSVIFLFFDGARVYFALSSMIGSYLPLILFFTFLLSFSLPNGRDCGFRPPGSVLTPLSFTEFFRSSLSPPPPTPLVFFFFSVLIRSSSPSVCLLFPFFFLFLKLF